jgi:CTP:molybdopterin cytidylyltransferase MocA
VGERRSFAGLILAGGAGRRWGGPKAWARLPDGRSFLAACAGVMRAAGAAPVVATVPPGTHDPRLAGLEVAALPGPGLDMLASARFGLRLLLGSPSWDVVVLLPVDHPLVSPGTVSAVAGAARPAAIPCLDDRHGHPVAFDRAVARTTTVGEHWSTLREVLRAAGAVDVAVHDPGVRANCNTPEVLAEAWAAATAPLERD